MCTKHRLFPIEQQSGLSLPSLHFYSQKWHLDLILTEGHIVWFFLFFFFSPLLQFIKIVFLLFVSISMELLLHLGLCLDEHMNAPEPAVSTLTYTDQKASNLSLFIIYWGEDQKEGNEAETLKTCVISRQSSEQPQDRKCRDEG